MAAAEKNPPSRPLVPPDERFWKRYSPHYELPLAGATSIFVHGLAVGILAVGGLAMLFSGSVEASRPAPMDVVFVEDGGGFGGPGGDSSLPGTPGQTDAGPPGAMIGPEIGEEPRPDGFEELPPVRDVELEVPPPESLPELGGELLQKFKQLNLDAEKRAKDPAPKPIGPPKGGVGAKAPKGPSGQGGVGGKDKGGKPGPGGPVGIGRKATEQEIKAWRWHFDLNGSPKEHADKLDRAGLIIAVPVPTGGPSDAKGPHLIIRDLKRRPVTMEKGDYAKYDDAVKWSNRKPDSIFGLAHELKLPFVPTYVVLLLPKDREAKMAAEERRFAMKNGNDLAKVQETWFDFRLQDGVYEPVAIRQK